eukprot:2273838-Rhodomonas_salina.1
MPVLHITYGDRLCQYRMLHRLIRYASTAHAHTNIALLTSSLLHFGFSPPPPPPPPPPSVAPPP